MNEELTLNTCGFNLCKYHTKKQIKEHLSFSSDDWIKSSVKSNFDFFLDQYKYSICAKQKDIKLAIKEIEEYYNQTL